jgi:hypothetical protein
MEYSFVINYGEKDSGFTIDYNDLGKTPSNIYTSKQYTNFHKCISDLINSCCNVQDTKIIDTKEIKYYKKGKLIKHVIMHGDGEIIYL